MNTLSIAALCVVVATAAPLQKQEEYCVSQWWPRACSADAEECQTGSEWYVDWVSCMGEFEDTSAPDSWCLTSTNTCEDQGEQCPTDAPRFGGEQACLDDEAALEQPPAHLFQFCVSSWYPRQCDMLMAGECVVGTEYYATYAECLGNEPAPATDGYCVNAWWPTKTCGLVSNHNETACIGWYPAGGYHDEAACIGFVVAPEEEEPVEVGVACVEQWWPRQCGLTEAANCVAWSPYFDSVEECYGDEAPVVDGFCIKSWDPKTCGSIDDDCIGWMPVNGGWATEEDCMGPPEVYTDAETDVEVDAETDVEVDAETDVEVDAETDVEVEMPTK